jgi:riboflavin kinase/FMN adenylyltransferase
MSAVVTIGNFDGVHLGHLALVGRAVAEGARLDVPVIALTFDPHPAAVLRPDAVPPALQSVEERVAMLRASGCDRVEVRAFDAALAALTPEQFVSDILIGELGAVAVVVGENFRFGAAAKGDVASLRSFGEAQGFTVEAVGLVESGHGPVSSSAIRALLAAGDLEAVEQALGRHYLVDGEVVRGDGRGRTIGIPTANVAVDPARASPADGVYACWATPEDEVDGLAPATVPAVVNVGWRPTFDGTSRTVEAHLLVDDGPDLYGRRLQLAFVARIRGEERFDGPEALVARIGEDIEAARQLLGTS